MIDHILESYTVLDLSTSVAGSFCTRCLALMGAEVIKAEPPGGDPVRFLGPFPGDVPDPRTSGLFLFLNANKKSITLDISTPKGREITLALARQVDLIVEDRPPGFLAELGMGYVVLQELNPALVLCSITPFGQDGPYRDFLATELTALALGGIAYVTGDPTREPLTPRGYHASLITGHAATVATLAVLFRAGLTGQGQQVDVSSFEAIVSMLECSTTIYEYSGAVRSRSGGGRGSHYLALLPTANGEIGVNTVTPKAWETMCLMMDVPELITDPRFATGPLRAEHAPEISAIIGPWVAARTKEEVYQIAQSLHIPFGPVRTTEDIFACPQHLEREFFADVTCEALGSVKLPSLPFREAGGGPARVRPAPSLGEHNSEVYQERLGFGEDELVALRRASVI